MKEIIFNVNSGELYVKPIFTGLLRTSYYFCLFDNTFNELFSTPESTLCDVNSINFPKVSLPFSEICKTQCRLQFDATFINADEFDIINTFKIELEFFQTGSKLTTLLLKEGKFTGELESLQEHILLKKSI